MLDAVPPPDELTPPVPEPAAEPAAPRAWLVIGPIIVQSSATLVIGVAMLVIGLLAGLWLRPLVPGLGGQAVATAAPGSASSGPVSPAEETQVAADGAALMAALVGQTRHFLGNADAPVTIIEFADFQCPYCGRFQTETFGQINDNYIASGQVRIGFQHFAFLGQESIWAAEATECASDQDAFWQYHDYLFAHQSGENGGAFSKEYLKQFAADLGLNTADFNSCLDSSKYAATVTAETQAAQQLGVRSTPTFVVNGRPVLGAQPYAVFQQYIGLGLND